MAILSKDDFESAQRQNDLLYVIAMRLDTLNRTLERLVTALEQDAKVSAVKRDPAREEVPLPMKSTGT